MRESIGEGLGYRSDHDQEFPRSWSPALLVMIAVAIGLMVVGGLYEWSFSRIKPALEPLAAHELNKFDAVVLSGVSPR
jgi:hypothetical protein